MDHKPLEYGDLIFVHEKNFVSRAINFIQKLRSSDKSSAFNHVGIVSLPSSELFETTGWISGYTNIYKEYKDATIYVARWKEMCQNKFKIGLGKIEYNNGKFYPYWRWLFHIVGLHKYATFGAMDCVSMSANFIWHSGYKLKKMNPWDYNVDQLWDELKCNDDWEIFKLWGDDITT